mgnify:CR=1 FL=1
MRLSGAGALSRMTLVRVTARAELTALGDTPNAASAATPLRLFDTPYAISSVDAAQSSGANFALSPSVLKVVSTYLRQVPVLSRTRPPVPGSRPRSTQPKHSTPKPCASSTG